ncbi:sialate O-acetylesterase [Algibacter sp. Ld11]|uniref:sialate O-acetylesterase n=1 Tax=Algibacter sp. Ld11 TaxID=649150 RepID=UPI00386710FE
MKFALLTISLFFTCLLSAQTEDVITLWPDKVPNELRPKQLPRQTDNTSNNVIRLTDVTNPTLTVFKPKHSNGSQAGIIVCPGGGYSILAIDKEGYEVAEWLNNLGYTAFVLQYRVPKNQKGAAQDIQRAIKVVRSKASEFNLDTDKIGLIGFSAGGHLSALASTNEGTSFYEHKDTIDEFSSKSNFTMLIYPAYLDKGENQTINPDFSLDKNTPPFFIFGTADDRFGNSSFVMGQALRNNKTPVELHVYPDGGHGYGLRKGNVAAEIWPKLAGKWLKSMAKPAKKEKLDRTYNFPKAEVKPKALPKKKDVWVFIMAGQSNMAGRGYEEPQDTITSSRVLTINKKNDIVLAKEPLHFYEPKMGGLDSGLSFAKNLLAEIPENTSVLLIPTAVGGSSISQWLGDANHRDVKLLSNFKEKVALAKKYGKVKGILWHQGESDANSKKIAKHDDNLTALFKTFRKSVGNKKLPILVGELGSYSKKDALWSQMNAIINEHAKGDKYMSVINTADFIDKGDAVHFNSESQRLLGKRYAEAFLKTIKK